MICRISGKKDVHLAIEWKLLINLPGGCAARRGRIFTTGLTIMGSHFQ